MYNKVTAADIAALQAILGEADVIFGEAINPDYAHDELGGISCMPEVLVRVHNKEEVSAIMKYAWDHTIPVTVRGRGTGLVGAAVPIHGGILLETTRMNKILALDSNNLTVTVQPGVLLMELAAFAEENDFLYPPDPGEKSATIGGNISTNAGGMRAVKYGVTRDYVRALTVVLPNGEIQTFGAAVAKNSSGYSLKDLIIGSEGTLAIICEAVLKLVPLPKVSVSLLVPFPDMKSAIEAVPHIIRSKIIPTAIEYMSRDTILFSESHLGEKFPDTKNDAYILLTFDGNTDAQVEQDMSTVAELCLKIGALDAYIVDTEERKKSVWSARGAFLEAIKASTTEMDECDVVVPGNQVDTFIKFTHDLADEFKVRIPSFGHAGDCEEAHVAGTEFLAGLCRSEKVLSDIVITTNNGYPLDQNIYQSVKGMTAGEATCKEGGVIIMAAACNDGHGGQSFLETMTQDLTPPRILEQIQATEKQDTVPDQWESQILARILSRFSVVLVSEADPDMVKAMKMHPAKDLPEALVMAESLLGYPGNITLIPEGISTIIA